MSVIPNFRTDIYVRTTSPVRTIDGEPAPEGTTTTLTHPVVAWDQDGTPLITTSPIVEGSWSQNGRLVLASSFPDYELFVAQPVLAVAAEPEPAVAPDPHEVVEIVPGSGEELVYSLPDGSTHRGVIPLWGRRADGSVTALLTAETVPLVRTVVRDDQGEISGTVESTVGE